MVERTEQEQADWNLAIKLEDGFGKNRHERRERLARAIAAARAEGLEAGKQLAEACRPIFEYMQCYYEDSEVLTARAALRAWDAM